MNAIADAGVPTDRGVEAVAESPGARRRHVPVSIALVWGLGAIAFAAIILAFTPYTYSLDDIKVTLQFAVAPMVGGLLAVALVRGHTQPLHPWIGLALLAYVLLGLLSTLLADFHWLAWQEWGSELTLMVGFATVAWTASTVRRFKNFCRFFFAIGCLTIVLGLFHYYGGVRWLLFRLYPGGQPSSEGHLSPFYVLLATLDQNPMMLSTILNRDFYPAYLLMIAPLAAAFLLDSRRMAWKLIFAVVGLLYVFTIILTKSNDSYLATAAIVILLAVLLGGGRPWARIPRRTLRVWVGGGLVLVGTALFSVRSYYTEFSNHLWPSIRSRQIMWAGAWHIFFDPSPPLTTVLRHMIVGSGPGGYLELFPYYRAPDYYRWGIAPITQFSHSQPMDLLSERGLLGLAAFSAFLGGILWLLIRAIRLRRDGLLHPYLAAVFTGIVGISIQNLTSPNIRWTACGFNYWYLLGLGVAAARLGMPSEERERLDRTWALPPGLSRLAGISLLAAMLLFEVCSIPYGLRRFPAAMYDNDARINEAELSRLVTMMNAAPPQQKENLRRAALESARAAETNCERSLQWLPTFLTSRYLLGSISAKHSAFAVDPAEIVQTRQRAIAAFDRLTALAPEYAEIHTLCGLLYQTAYKQDKQPHYKELTLAHLEKAANQTTAFHPRLLYARTLLMMDEPEKARTVYWKVLDTAQSLPPDRIAGLGIREVFDDLLAEARAARNRQQIIELCRRQLEVEPFDASVFVELTDELRRAGQHAEILTLCQKWIERNPIDPLPRNVAAQIFIDVKGWRRALSQTQACLLIQRYHQSGEGSPWAASLPESVRQVRDPMPADLWLRTGQLVETLGETSDALKCYQKSIAEAGGSPTGYQARLAIEAMRARRAAAGKR